VSSSIQPGPPKEEHNHLQFSFEISLTREDQTHILRRKTEIRVSRLEPEDLWLSPLFGL
jgi:hypothetical protein